MNGGFLLNQEDHTAITPPRDVHGCFKTIAKNTSRQKTQTDGGGWPRRTVTRYRCRCCCTNPICMFVQFLKTKSHILSRQRLNPVPMVHTKLLCTNISAIARSGAPTGAEKTGVDGGMVSNVRCVHTVDHRGA